MLPDDVSECPCGVPIVHGSSLCDPCWKWGCEEMGVDPKTGLDKAGNDRYDDVVAYVTKKMYEPV